MADETIERISLPPHAAESIRYIEAVPEQADALRLDGLESLQQLRASKGAMLEREHARLTEKYGADHPRVTELGAHISTNRALVRGINSEAGRARVAQVDADPKAWIVHGRVMSCDLQGQPNLTVALYD